MSRYEVLDPDPVEASLLAELVDAGYEVTSAVRLPESPGREGARTAESSLRVEVRDPGSGREHVARLLRFGVEDGLWFSTQGWSRTGILPTASPGGGADRWLVKRYLVDVDGDGEPTRGSSIGARNADLVRAAEVRGTLPEAVLAALAGHSLRDLLHLYEVDRWVLDGALPLFEDLASGVPFEWAVRRSSAART